MQHDAWKRYSENSSWFYDVTCPGYKYNMTDIQAALGLQQLRKLPAFHTRRRAIVERYQSAFRNREWFGLPVQRADVQHAWHLYVLRLNPDRLGITRNEFIRQMRERNIGCSVHFIPIHLHRYYREKYGLKPEDFPVATRECERIVSLPLSAGMTDDDVEDVIEAVSDIVEEARHPRGVRGTDAVRA